MSEKCEVCEWSNTGLVRYQDILMCPGCTGRHIEALAARVDELKKLISTPEIKDFLKAVPIEAAHQCQRWGEVHDAKKSDADWAFLVGHLSGRSIGYGRAGDRDKQLHHIITCAAACLNWHRHTVAGQKYRFEYGVEGESSLIDKKPGPYNDAGGWIGWACDKSPTGRCVYAVGDPCDYCGEPEERK